VAMEENTDVYNTAQPAVFIRIVNEDYRLTEGRPKEIRVKKTVAGNVFPQLVILVNKSELLWKQMRGFVSDSARAMIEKQNGVAENKKKKLKKLLFSSEPTLLFITKHCAKILKINKVIDTVRKQNRQFHSCRCS
jgi:hypothetical protein